MAPPGVEAVIFDGLAALPAFNPDDDQDAVPAPVRDLRAAIDAAEAVLFCSPEYAGALPGAFKNLLDWTVGAVPGLDRKPVGWVNVAAPGRGIGADAELAAIEAGAQDFEPGEEEGQTLFLTDPSDLDAVAKALPSRPTRPQS